MSARHTDPDDGSFGRSLGRALLVGLAAMVVTAVATGLLTRLGTPQGSTAALGGGAEAPSGSATSSPAASPAGTDAPPATGAPADSPAATEPTATEPAPTEAGATAPAGDGDDVAASDPVSGTSETTVQVLDATVGPDDAAADAAQALRDLGYTVVVVNTARRVYERTTVVATPGHEAEAEALGERDPRFGFIGSGLQLSPSVDLHVIVGEDWVVSR